jgi:arylsulfatase A
MQNYGDLIVKSHTPSRREFLKHLGLGLTTLAAARTVPAAPSTQPNIVLIMADDIGYEGIGCYGSASYTTPVLDGLAATGMKFTQCYSQPLCTPSRTKIMTGRYNFRNYTDFGYFDLNEKTFAHVAKTAGYATCIAGKWQLMGGGANGPYQAGFDEYCLWHMEDAFTPKGSRYRDPKIVQNGALLTGLAGQYGPDVYCDYILDFIDRNKTNPFLVYFPMALVHNPFEPTPDSPEWGAAVSGTEFFDDMVAYMDKLVGRIIQKLDDLGLRNNTLLLFTGDNGTNKNITSDMDDGSSITGGKGTTPDAGNYVALIADWQGTIPPGAVSDDLVDFSDFLPTIAEAAGASLPAGVTIDGKSFLPQLRGETGTPRQWIFIHYQRNASNEPQRFARTNRWKLYDTGTFTRAGKLYDIENDPLEQNPIAPGHSPESDQARTTLQTVIDNIETGGAPIPEKTPSLIIPYFQT